MHADDEDLFVIRAVEDADAAALGQVLHAPPEKVVIQILGRRPLERRDDAALRVDAGHDVLDRAVLAGGVERLEDEQQRPAVLGVHPLLELGEPFDAAFQQIAGLFLHVEAEVSPGSMSFMRKRLSVMRYCVASCDSRSLAMMVGQSNPRDGAEVSQGRGLPGRTAGA